MKRGKGVKTETKSMFGKEPFKMQPKKPEPDDRPRTPVRPASQNKNMTKTRGARQKRLAGVML
jgi:hypothetical protein